MRPHMRSLLQATVAAIFLVAAAIAQAETWPLELKRLESRDSARGVFDRMDYIYRATNPQHFFLQMAPDGKGGVRFMGNEQHAAAFKKIVTKEPEYHCQQPFKGVAKLGTQEFAFALDTSTPKPKEKDEKAEKEKEKEKEKAKAEPSAESAIAKLKEMMAKTKPAPLSSATTMPAYDRLYFDFNHNGDLTDDKMVEGKVQTHSRSSERSYTQLTFPRLDVTIDADGTPVESAIFFSGTMISSSDFNHVQIQINAGAYREGDITLEGKKRHVVLIDFNSNGRFDDEMKVRKGVHGNNGQIYPEYGDLLLVDPGLRISGFDSPYDATSADYRHNVSRLVNIDGRFYDLKVTPAGDKLTLEASSVATGSVTNPNNGFRTLIYSDMGVLKISGNKGTPVPVPEGEWKLLSYTIDLTGAPKPVEPPKKEEKKAEKETSALKAMEGAFKAFFSNPSVRALSRPRWSMVSAQATEDYKAVKVVKGETVELPFGPPYKPLVTAQNYGNRKQMELEMSLVGSAGEICGNMMVDGGRPGKPEFTITDPKGEVVQQGSFEYG